MKTETLDKLNDRLTYLKSDEDKFFSTDRALRGTKVGAIFGVITYAALLTAGDILTGDEIFRSALNHPVEGTLTILGVGLRIYLSYCQHGNIDRGF